MLHLHQDYRNIPESILQNKYASIFATEWLKIHNRMDGNSFNFFIGGNGTGKTYAALRRAEIIGVDENDEYGRLFDQDHLENHVFFDKQDMLEKIAELEKKPLSETRGYQIILDEAQITANAKEWNNREVLNFSKDMTTIRSARLSIVLTMPTHRMITTDLRQLGIYQIEMSPAETMDLNRKISYSKIHYLKLNPHSGEIWRYRPLVKFPFISPVTGMKVIKHGRLNQISWKLPKIKTVRNYERMKKDFREERGIEVEKKKNSLKQVKRSMFKNIVETIRSDLPKFKKPDGNLSWYLIVKEFDCAAATAKKVISFLKQDGALNG